MYDRMRGFCASFLLMAFVLFYTGTAIADDNNWHVSNTSGNVWVTVGGVQQASLSHSSILKPGDSIRLAKTAGPFWCTAKSTCSSRQTQRSRFLKRRNKGC